MSPSPLEGIASYLSATFSSRNQALSYVFEVKQVLEAHYFEELSPLLSGGGPFETYCLAKK